MKHREYYRRHLPHWQLGGAVFFVTFRLKGSLPLELIEVLKEERKRKKGNPIKLPKEQQANQSYLDEAQYFRRWDSLLDKAESVPNGYHNLKSPKS